MKFFDIKRAAIWTLVLATIGIFAFDSYFEKDEVYQSVESFIRMDTAVRSEVGAIEKISLRNYRSVQASDSAGPYREYTVIVRGSLGVAVIIVRATPGGSPSEYRYAVQSIDR